MSSMIRSMLDERVITKAGAYAVRDAALLDKLSDSFFAGMRKVAEYNLEGVDGETRKMRKGKSFSEQVDDVVSGKHNPRFDLYVSDTPQYLVDLNFKKDALLMRSSKINEILEKHPEMDINFIKKYRMR